MIDADGAGAAGGRRRAGLIGALVLAAAAAWVVPALGSRIGAGQDTTDGWDATLAPGEAPEVDEGPARDAAIEDAGGDRAGVAADTATDVATDAAAGPETAGATGRVTGRVTGLPLPRYVSVRASEARARRGPSLRHGVDWVYRRRGLPLRVTAEHGHWRRVEDADGQGGWVHYSLISGTRTALVTRPMAELLARPAPGAHVEALMEAGVVARLGECVPGWCRLRAAGHRGWASRGALWGTDLGADAGGG